VARQGRRLQVCWLACAPLVWSPLVPLLEVKCARAPAWAAAGVQRRAATRVRLLLAVMWRVLLLLLPCAAKGFAGAATEQTATVVTTPQPCWDRLLPLLHLPPGWRWRLLRLLRLARRRCRWHQSPRQQPWAMLRLPLRRLLRVVARCRHWAWLRAVKA
jgi:hypothetical protein